LRYGYLFIFNVWRQRITSFIMKEIPADILVLLSISAKYSLSAKPNFDLKT
jgi:hypothetical protein